MSTVELLKNELNTQNLFTQTENGDTAYKSTLNANLDFFGTAGATRYDQRTLESLFYNAVNEDYKLAIMNLLYLRDVRGGLGERQSFRTCFKKICNMYPKDAEYLFPYIVEYGRFDDLFVAKDTKAEKAMISFINNQLKEDIKSLNENGQCSLLAKWMPSINASNSETIKLACFFASKLGYTKAEYRKLLVKLRQGKIIENNLREREYTFEYSNVPSKAMHKYRMAFIRNDRSRYASFINNVAEGNEKIHSKVLYPYEIIREYKCGNISELEEKAMQVKWEAIPRNEEPSNTIVVRDGSGSMWGLPLDIATSLSILFSEQINGEFKNKFITFSSHPELVEFSEGASLSEKLYKCYQYDECTNTDISKVYDLIFNTSLKITNKDEYIKRVVIISDMEFDQGVSNVPTYETMKEKFDKAGIPLPEIVYWNVKAHHVHFAADPSQPNIRFVSGASNHVIDSIINNKAVSAADLMLHTLKKYEEVCSKLTLN